MRLSIVWTIFRKEIVETLRDRRTLLMMIGLPILLYPLMIVGISKLQESQTEQREGRASAVAVWGGEADDLVDALNATGKITAKPWAGASVECRRLLEDPATRPPTGTVTGAMGRRDRATTIERENPMLAAARSVVTRRGVDGVLVVWPGFARATAEGRAGAVSVYFDSVQPDSVLARDRTADALGQYRAALIARREREHNLEPGFARAVEVLERNVATEQRRSGEMLGMLLPFILTVMSLLGALYPAIDLTAGEKERGTMQTLMCAPVSAQEIIVGKFMTVWAIALITALANVVSLAATLARIVPGVHLSLPLSAYLLTFGMLIPVTFSISALFLAVAAFARDFKDGQNFLMPVYMILAMPAALTMLPGIQLNAATAFLPVLNIALLIKSMMLAEVSADLLFLTLVSSIAYAGLSMLLAARVFQQEQVLLGGRQSIGQLLGLERRPGTVPGPALAIVSFAVVLVVVFYGSLLLEKAGVLVTLLVTEYGFFLVPTLVLVLGFGFRARDTLSLRLPPVRALVGAALLGASAWTVATGLLIRLLPPPDSLTQALERILLLDRTSVPVWAVWLAIGVTPAVCEELFFRGFVLSGLRRLGMLPALVITALLFGIAHSSIYRLLPTVFLGLVFGYAVWRTGSVACSVVAHTINNGLTASIAVAPAYFAWLGVAGGRFLPWKWTMLGCAVAVIGLLLVVSVPQYQYEGRKEQAVVEEGT